MTQKISDIEFEKIIHDNQFLIHKVCKIYCPSSSDIDDLFQDIVINLWKGISSFKGHSSLSTWIYRVGLNTAISKSKKLQKSRLVFPEKTPEKVEFNRQDEKDNLDSQITILHKAINQLKPVEKGIILLYLEEKSYEEIGEIIGISIKNVSVKLVRIKRKLKDLIGNSITLND